MSQVPNLKELFPSYRITYDPSADDKTDPHYFQIPCRVGTIYPFGPGKLAVEIDGHPKISKWLRDIPGVRFHQQGDREQTLTFPIEVFPKVASLVEPYIKTSNHLTTEGRRELALKSA